MNSLQFNIHLLSMSYVPGTVSGDGNIHEAITELGTARSALWRSRLIFLVYLIPLVQPLLPGLELEKKEESPESEPWEGRKEGRYNREEGERPGKVGDGQPAT